jgi:hypothetical protein
MNRKRGINMKEPTQITTCTEVIAIRLYKQELSESVCQLFEEVKSNIFLTDGCIKGMHLYCSNGIQSDWKIDIYSMPSKGKQPKKTAIGLQLAASLAAFGLVYHELWCRKASALVDNTKKATPT